MRPAENPCRFTVTQRRDDVSFTNWQSHYNGVPSQDLIDLAHAIVASGPPPGDDKPDTPRTTDEALAQDMRNVLAGYDIRDWSVVVHPNMSAQMSVNGPARTVKIRAGLRVTSETRDRLVVHEIGGHVLRWANSQEQPEPLLRQPLSDARTEEGLACLLEEHLGVSSPQARYTYAARVLAVSWAQTLGLVPLARHLCDLLPVPAAAELALRVKRGITNPEAPGGPTNAYHYLDGWEQGRKLYQQDPDGILLLRGTKWSYEHIPLVHHLADQGRLTQPRRAAQPHLLGVTDPR